MSTVAVDIGASNLRVALGDEKGLGRKISERTERLTGPEGISNQIIRMIRDLGAEPKRIGVGSIGPLDARRGLITNTPNYPFKNIPVTESLAKRFGARVTLLNDCGAAVQGERRFGAGKGLGNIFYVTISTGLGGGAIVDGRPINGKDGNAPEIGHLVIDRRSRLTCGCGCPGHWEAYCSGSGIPRLTRMLLEEWGIRESLLLGGELTAERIFDAARRGDEVALRVVEEIGEVNAVGFAGIVNAFDPELITVGGSVALKNPDLVLPPILAKVGGHLINRKPEIMLTPLGHDAVLYGALAATLA